MSNSITNALLVLVMTPKTRKFLGHVDPMALDQAERALKADGQIKDCTCVIGQPQMSCVVCDGRGFVLSANRG